MLGISHDNAHCGGYLCPIAERCVRYLLAMEWDKMEEKFPVAFIESDYKDGKCDNFWRKGLKMEKMRQFEMHKPEGSVYDIYTLYEWLGNVSIADIGHKFDINVKIVETKED